MGMGGNRNDTNGSTSTRRYNLIAVCNVFIFASTCDLAAARRNLAASISRLPSDDAMVVFFLITCNVLYKYRCT